MENSSTYNGRMIRIEGKDEETKNVQQTVILEKDQITFGEAAKAGLIKEGMIVIFSDEISSPIKLTFEMAGEEQEFSLTLASGIIVKNTSGDYAIFTFLKPFLSASCSFTHLSLKGRFARAYAYKTVNYIVNSVAKIPLELANFNDLELALGNYIFLDYIRENDRALYQYDRKSLVIFPYVAGVAYTDFHVGGIAQWYRQIGVFVGNNDTICSIKPNKMVTTQKGFSYASATLFPTHLYVKGVLK